MMESFDVVAEAIKVLRMEGHAILDCAQRLQESPSGEAFRQGVGLLQAALSRGGKIIVTGLGKSGKIGQKIASTLCSTGSLAVYLHPTEGLHGDLGLVHPQDAVLALSYTGNTDEVVQLLPSLTRRGVALIGIGGNASSKLASHCHVWIEARIEGEACPHNLAPTTSTTLSLALGDALAIALMQIRGFDADSFALNHPGGSLGKKLTLKVSDLMHAGKAIPQVKACDSMEQVVIVATEKKLGVVLVVEKELLLGIITDGDIRRALQHKEKFFSLAASEVMTKAPITVSPSTLAQKAFRVMEERTDPISVLPVVNERGEIKGVLRLHDVVQSF